MAAFSEPTFEKIWNDIEQRKDQSFDIPRSFAGITEPDSLRAVEEGDAEFIPIKSRSNLRASLVLGNDGNDENKWNLIVAKTYSNAGRVYYSLSEQSDRQFAIDIRFL
ncbi:MAG: hypothetical protein JWN76_1036 [Chitinophagaceae bacterium]|nr:hypothetical protein [Chitinophagaceae bacterium]